MDQNQFCPFEPSVEIECSLTLGSKISVAALASASLWGLVAAGSTTISFFVYADIPIYAIFFESSLPTFTAFGTKSSLGASL